MRDETLRVALIAGTLRKGGAEKQLVLVVRALLARGVDVKVYTLARGGYYAAAIRELGVGGDLLGRSNLPPLRLVQLMRGLRRFRPHIVQAGHFFTNLYAALGARSCGAIGLGAIRSDVYLELVTNGRWGPPLMRWPAALVANSQAARTNAAAAGYDQESVFVLPNAIDVDDFDRQSRRPLSPPIEIHSPVAITIGSLDPKKRVDRFLEALSIARRGVPDLAGIVVGDGPARSSIEQRASRLGLLPDGVAIVGQRDDVPALLRRSDFLVLSSEHEGFPNVLLEAMAARKPVLTTPAGDAGVVVREPTNGYVVEFEDVPRMAASMVELCRSEDLRCRMGTAGRKMVEQRYGIGGLPRRLLDLYERIAGYLGRYDTAAVIKSRNTAAHRA